MKNRAIFRNSAIQRYIQRRDKDVLPRLVRPPAFVFLWILLSLALLAGALTWQIRVPVYMAVPGVMVQDAPTARLQALLFVSPNQRSSIQPGQPVQLRIGTGELRLHLVVTSVASQVLSPAQIRTHYALDTALGLVANQPAVVAIVAMQANAALQGYAGSLVSAQIQIGTRSVLSLLPVFDHLRGA